MAEFEREKDAKKQGRGDRQCDLHRLDLVAEKVEGERRGFEGWHLTSFLPPPVVRPQSWA
jgi:hypothetical protein